MWKEDLKYADLTQSIINACMKIHTTLGMGFMEMIYHRALIVELEIRNILFQSEQELPIYYEGRLLGKRRLDLLVDRKVLVELKATSELEKKHFAQTLNYLEAFNIEIGLLFNFGSNSLQFKRFINNKYKLK